MLLFHEHIYFMPKEKKGEQGTKHTMKLSYLFIERKKKDPRVQSSLSLETNSTWIAFNFQSGGNIIEP